MWKATKKAFFLLRMKLSHQLIPNRTYKSERFAIDIERSQIVLMLCDQHGFQLERICQDERSEVFRKFGKVERWRSIANQEVIRP
jgi:hypothetical protein